MKTSTKVISALAAGAGLWALNRMRRRSLLDLPGKVVLITGGSRGLGLATAREFGAQGSMVAICARDHEEGLRSELAPEGICVTTIAPGLLRTGSHLNARFKGKQTGEYLAFSAGSATPVVSIAAERAARSIVSSTVRGETERVLSVPAAALALVHGIAPGFTTDVLSLVNRLLPSEKNGGTSSRTGQQIEDQMNSRIWRFFTSSGYEAAESLNELSANQQLANS